MDVCGYGWIQGVSPNEVLDAALLLMRSVNVEGFGFLWEREFLALRTAPQLLNDACMHACALHFFALQGGKVRRFCCCACACALLLVQGTGLQGRE